MFDEEIAGFREWAKTNGALPAEVARQLTEIDQVERALARLGREPVLKPGGNIDEGMLAITLYWLRMGVAVANDLPRPADVTAEISANIAKRKAEREAEWARQEASEAKEKARKARAAARPLKVRDAE